ncbi:hypothetical protein PUV54_03310 [Hyphococcus flavus]|uniref:Lipoprotein n=1 Tax=Hyphococcus flavus TaxID=1866326 RepID=A0AAE9ZKC7_9PROT|nr:hypothetical protein [Hyphococcus flavus]WDI32220.1 hypothetical protein PUV54_03310 [Hyphococcus flavus]
MKNVTRFAAIAAGAGLLAACGGGGEEAREKQIEDMAKRHGVNADVELDDKGEVASVKINNGMGGATVGSNLSLPDNFPSDVSVDDNWSVMAISPAPGVDGFMVNAMTDDSVEETLSKLRSSLGAKGWTEEASDQPTPQMQRINFVKDDRMTNVNLISGGPQLTVQLVTMKKPG